MRRNSTSNGYSPVEGSLALTLVFPTTPNAKTGGHTPRIVSSAASEEEAKRPRTCRTKRKRHEKEEGDDDDASATEEEDFSLVLKADKKPKKKAFFVLAGSKTCSIHFGGREHLLAPNVILQHGSFKEKG